MKTKLPYRLDDKLFFRNASSEDTFCFLKSMCSEIFQLVNDQQALKVKLLGLSRRERTHNHIESVLFLFVVSGLG